MFLFHTSLSSLSCTDRANSCKRCLPGDYFTSFWVPRWALEAPSKSCDTYLCNGPPRCHSVSGSGASLGPGLLAATAKAEPLSTCHRTPRPPVKPDKLAQPALLWAYLAAEHGPPLRIFLLSGPCTPKFECCKLAYRGRPRQPNSIPLPPMSVGQISIRLCIPDARAHQGETQPLEAESPHTA